MFDFIVENRFYPDGDFDVPRYLERAQRKRHLSPNAMQLLAALLDQDEDGRIWNLAHYNNFPFIPPETQRNGFVQGLRYVLILILLN